MEEERVVDEFGLWLLGKGVEREEDRLEQIEGTYYMI